MTRDCHERPPRPPHRRRMLGGAVGVVLAGVAVATGCGPRDTRVRHRVSGRISYGGKPVVGGEIIFTPDGTKKNTGAQGIATIKDGTFDTRGTRAAGVGGGPMTAMVMGFLEADGSRFFEHALPIECSISGDTVLDIDVAPATAPARTQSPI